MRVAVVIKDRCHPEKCGGICIRFCPRVRAGVVDTITMGDDGKPMISEDLCIGCGICVNKCPFEAIKIVGLPEELKSGIIHQYGVNGFRLFNLPQPKSGSIVGILGQNGTGKTTAVNILSGRLIPNLGELDEKEDWSKVLEKFSGSEIGSYFKTIADGKIECSLKPQCIDMLPTIYKGKIKDLLLRNGDEPRVEKFMEELDIEKIGSKSLKEVSGGELQRVAIAAAMIKESNIYMFDEPSSYLDIYQRLRVAKKIRELAKESSVIVVEHDLAILDYLADNVNLVYGAEGVYGIVTPYYKVRNAINIYLKGYLPGENIRFRDSEITFEKHPPKKKVERKPLISFDRLKKRYKNFELAVGKGELCKGDVVGVVGPNAIGKTTFIMMLAGLVEPSAGKIDSKIRVSYKPQYLRGDYDSTVEELFGRLCPDLLTPYYGAMVVEPLRIKPFFKNNMGSLSGGELQRVAIALCLGRDGDLYLIDEPSAYLDSSQRMEAARTIRRVVESRGRSAYVVDHDIYFIDMLADELIVFEGKPGRYGKARGPLPMREGMNTFFSGLSITFRRDEETNRPRVNKPESKLDREQKSRGEYYYTE